MILLLMMLVAAVGMSTAGGTAHAKMALQTFSVLAGAGAHDVYPAPDGADWFTEGGQNSIALVDPATRAVKLFSLPNERRNVNLNIATFDRQGVLWFTGQNGIYGRLDTKTGAMAVFDAPRGTGPYGIATTPDGQVFFASLAGNYLGQIDLETGGV